MRNRRCLQLLLISAPGAALAAAEGEEPLVLKQAPGQDAQSVQINLQPDELRDIHGPVPLAAFPPYWSIGGAIAALLAILAAYLYFKKKRKPAANPPPPPWETALAELAAAKALQSQALLYVERVGEILRRYIESRFAIRSTRQTTGEFLAGLSHAGERNPLAPFQTELKACLEQADMAKFARLVPDSEVMAQMEEAVREFVKKTEPPQSGGKS